MRHFNIIALIFLVVFFVFISSCKNKEKQDVNLIADSEFIKILIDIHLVDAYMQVNPDTFKVNYDSLYNTILLKHKTSKKEIEFNIEKRCDSFENFQALYTHILDSLSALKGIEMQKMESIVNKKK